MLELKHITKIFPGVVALDDVSVGFQPGEIHALMGENGAGKSTLVKIITGIYQPDLGEIYISGKPVKIRNFHDAIMHEINMVSQEIQVIPQATVAENIVLDKITDFRVNGLINWKKVNRKAEEFLHMVGLNLKPTEKIGGLTAAQKQLIQIAKALSSNAGYILLDEPTSSLTKHETDNLFKIIRRLKSEGVAIIFVSHKIDEVMELCDKVTVLRDGRYIGTRDTAEMERQDIVRMMIGREESDRHLGFLDILDEKALVVRNMTSYGKFNDFNLNLKKGEILGLYGLVGSGRTEFARIIIGADRMDEGEVHINGRKAEINSLKDSLNKYRMGYVTENRKEEGLILTDSVARNITITVWQRIINRFRKINAGEDDKIIQSMIEKIKIKTPSPGTRADNLSGGNQQKVSISKWLAADCDILIIDEPTVGVDVGAREYIHELIWNLAKLEGKSIILISSDMSEIIKLARRILVFRNFRIAGEIDYLNSAEISYQDVSMKIGALLA